MITLDEFMSANIGNSFKNDYGAQCVLLVKKFSEQVLGINLWYFGWSAKAWYENNYDTFDSRLWDKIPNTPDGVPSPGSLIFFKWNNFSKYGHVAVVVSATVNEVVVLEQNGWAGTGSWEWTDAIRLNTYGYSQVQWWMTSTQKVNQPLTLDEAIKKYSMENIVVLYKGKYYINHEGVRTVIDDLNYKKILW